MQYKFEVNQTLRVLVYDVDPDKLDFMGKAVCKNSIYARSVKLTVSAKDNIFISNIITQLLIFLLFTGVFCCGCRSGTWKLQTSRAQVRIIQYSYYIVLFQRMEDII